MIIISSNHYIFGMNKQDKQDTQVFETGFIYFLLKGRENRHTEDTYNPF